MPLREFLDYRLFELGEHTITVATVAVFILIVLTAYVLSRLIQRAVHRLLNRREISDRGTVELTLRLTHYAIMAFGIAVGFQAVGVNLGALFAAGALFAVALGFAMQNIAENFVSGLLLLGERAIKPGDILEVEGEVVRVVRMGVRSTVARTRDEEDLIIPNSKLVQSIVKNFTLRDSVRRIHAKVGVTYDSDVEHVFAVLEKAVASIDWTHPDYPPQVVLTAFGSSSIDFEVRVWIDDPWSLSALVSDLHRRVWHALREADITIAFPQLDVHLDRAALDALGRPRPAGPEA